MVKSQKMKIANERASKFIRGTVQNKKANTDKYPVGPWILGLFLFLVCGSAIFQIVQIVWSQY